MKCKCGTWRLSASLTILFLLSLAVGAQAQKRYRFVANPTVVGYSYNGANVYDSFWTEDINNLGQVVESQVQPVLRSPSNIWTDLWTGGAPTMVQQFLPRQAPTSMSAHYARLNNMGDLFGVQRDGSLWVYAHDGSFSALPMPPGNVVLPDSRQPWPLYQLSEGPPLAVNDWGDFTAHTTTGIWLWYGAWGQLDNSPNAQAFRQTDRGHVAGMDGAYNPVVWYYGGKQTFARRPAGTNTSTWAGKTISVNEMGFAVGTDIPVQTPGGPSGPYQAWIGRFGSTGTANLPKMSMATAMNNGLQVVGIDYRSNPAVDEGVLAEYGTASYLKDLVDGSGAGLLHLHPTAINDHGVITVNAMSGGQAVSGVLVPNYQVNNWWVKEGGHVARNSTQPFKLEVLGLPVGSYTASWMVDDDTAHMNPMSAVNNSEGPHMEADISLSGWNWQPVDHRYYVTYVIKKGGQIMAVDTHSFYVQ